MIHQIHQIHKKNLCGICWLSDDYIHICEYIGTQLLKQNLGKIISRTIEIVILKQSAVIAKSNHSSDDCIYAT